MYLCSGLNPFVGCTPSVPEGVNLAYGKDEFLEYETLGAEAASEAAFVLVAGGLGERLGYSGIKVALPVDSASGRCFLQARFSLKLEQNGWKDRPKCNCRKYFN